jgi:hypothetical protein
MHSSKPTKANKRSPSRPIKLVKSVKNKSVLQTKRSVSTRNNKLTKIPALKRTKSSLVPQFAPSHSKNVTQRVKSSIQQFAAAPMMKMLLNVNIQPPIPNTNQTVKMNTNPALLSPRTDAILYHANEFDFGLDRRQNAPRNNQYVEINSGVHKIQIVSNIDQQLTSFVTQFWSQAVKPPLSTQLRTYTIKSPHTIPTLIMMPRKYFSTTSQNGEDTTEDNSTTGGAPFWPPIPSKKPKHGPDIDGLPPNPPREYPFPKLGDSDDEEYEPPVEIEVDDPKPLGRAGGSNSGIGKEAEKGEKEIESSEEEGISIPAGA